STRRHTDGELHLRALRAPLLTRHTRRLPRLPLRAALEAIPSLPAADDRRRAGQEPLRRLRAAPACIQAADRGAALDPRDLLQARVAPRARGSPLEPPGVHRRARAVRVHRAHERAGTELWRWK